MRHYGKDGMQCRPVVEHASGKAEACRLVARSVLFGRVPRSVVVWLGVGVTLASLLIGVLCLSSVDCSYTTNFHRDMTSSLLIRR